MITHHKKGSKALSQALALLWFKPPVSILVNDSYETKKILPDERGYLAR
jgi:hypothetical protein